MPYCTKVNSPAFYIMTMPWLLKSNFSLPDPFQFTSDVLFNSMSPSNK